jgi:hypothetical protein
VAIGRVTTNGVPGFANSRWWHRNSVCTIPNSSRFIHGCAFDVQTQVHTRCENDPTKWPKSEWSSGVSLSHECPVTELIRAAIAEMD